MRWHSVSTTQAHRLHHDAVVVIGNVWEGQGALATSADRIRLVNDRAVNCMHNASAVSCGSVHFFKNLDVCEPHIPKVTPALDDFVDTQI